MVCASVDVSQAAFLSPSRGRRKRPLCGQQRRREGHLRSRRARAGAAHLCAAGAGGRPHTLTSGVPGAVAAGANPNVPRLPLTPGRGSRWVPLPFSSAQMPRSGDHWPGNCRKGTDHAGSGARSRQPQCRGPAEASRGCVTCWDWGPGSQGSGLRQHWPGAGPAAAFAKACPAGSTT